MLQFFRMGYLERHWHWWMHPYGCLHRPQFPSKNAVSCWNVMGDQWDAFFGRGVLPVDPMQLLVVVFFIVDGSNVSQPNLLAQKVWILRGPNLWKYYSARWYTRWTHGVGQKKLTTLAFLMVYIPHTSKFNDTWNSSDAATKIPRGQALTKGCQYSKLWQALRAHISGKPQMNPGITEMAHDASPLKYQENI